jgi:exopolyphosphatase/guanosine-5'-triphosphate,3'-diphosphate pyrophosphatase
MPFYASIDVGSNTLRLLIGSFKNGRLIDICYKRAITRLGTGVNQTGKLQDINIAASLEVLKEFSSLISTHRVKHVKAVATSALREASNSDIFIERASAQTGILIEVISGEKEAELTLTGILSSLPESFARHPLLIFDIGGGSTEWIISKDKHPVDIGSIPVGVIKLAGSYIKTDPVTETDLAALNREIVSYLYTLKAKINSFIDKETRLIGTAGTFTTIASIDLGLETYSREKVHLLSLPIRRLLAMSKRLLSLPLEKRKKVRGLEPERADLIIPGLQFTINIMEIFNIHELTVNEYGLLEGLLFNMLKK